ncbi:MAG: universal stress protein [Halobacteriales archaeon]
MSRMSLLVPVLFPREDSLSDANVQGLAAFDITMFGYWRTPDEIDPAAVRDDHESEAQAHLYELATEFARAGATTDIQLHFGPAGEDMHALQNRIAEETDADAIVIPNRITLWNNILVPLRDDRNKDRIVEFLTAFEPDQVFTLELFHAASSEDDASAAQEMLAGVAESLLARGFTESDLEITVEVATDPEAAIIERGRSHNVIVIGETEERAGPNQFFGPTYERIADRTEIPVVVVRKSRERHPQIQSSE